MSNYRILNSEKTVRVGPMTPQRLDFRQARPLITSGYVPPFQPDWTRGRFPRRHLYLRAVLVGDSYKGRGTDRSHKSAYLRRFGSHQTIGTPGRLEPDGAPQSTARALSISPQPAHGGRSRSTPLPPRNVRPRHLGAGRAGESVRLTTADAMSRCCHRENRPDRCLPCRPQSCTL